MRKVYADPEAHARLVVRNREQGAKMSCEERERRRDRVARMRQDKLSHEHWLKSQRPEVRKRVGQMNTDRTLGWCPPEQRDHYRYLTRGLHYRAAEARAIIEADVASQRAAILRDGRTFAGQLARVAAGAQLVDVNPLRRPDPSVTLGGIASAALA